MFVLIAEETRYCYSNAEERSVLQKAVLILPGFGEEVILRLGKIKALSSVSLLTSAHGATVVIVDCLPVKSMEAISIFTVFTCELCIRLSGVNSA
jgi:hypothetical protein